ncbi:MAG: hypothetical protein JWP97_6236 [Labilithrix sp.]|nr:hypothetical protein [Labilithrix sp.]
MIVDNLEKAINEISDKDWNWWPFLWLRPDPGSRLSLGRLSVVAVLYGLPISMVVGLLTRRFGSPPAAFPLVLAGFPMLLLFVGSVIVAPMWNRRAERLRGRP